MPVYNEKDRKKWTKKGEHYYFRCYYIDLNGKKKQKKSKKFLTASLAKVAERQFLEKTSVSNESNNKIEFDTAFFEWLEVKKMQVKPSTYYCIVHKAQKYILSFFSDIPIATRFSANCGEVSFLHI